MIDPTVHLPDGLAGVEFVACHKKCLRQTWKLLNSPEAADAHLQSAKVLARQSRASEARVAFQRCAGSKDERESTLAKECQRLLRELSP